MKKITILKTPKPDILTRDEVDVLFEKYEKSLTLPVAESLKELTYKKELLLHEQILRVDSNISHTIINEISRYIPLIIVKNEDINAIKIEKIQHVDVITKKRTKCYDYKRESDYYAYDGEKIIVIGFYVPSFKDLSKIVLNELYKINKSIQWMYVNGNYTRPLLSLYYSSEFGLDAILGREILIDKNNSKLIENFYINLSSGLNGNTSKNTSKDTSKDTSKKKGGYVIPIEDKTQIVLFKHDPMAYINPIIALLEYLSKFHFSSKLLNINLPTVTHLSQQLNTKYDEFLKTKIAKKNVIADEDLYYYGRGKFLLKLLKEYNKNYKLLEESYDNEAKIKMDIKNNLNKIMEDKSIKIELDIIANRRFKTNYNSLTKDQKIQVNKDRDNKLSFERALIKNNCKHVIIYKEIMKNNSDERQKQLLTALTKFIDSKKITSKDFIKCNVCKLDIICPHVYDKFHGMENSSITTKYSGDKNSTSSNYVCDICGENIIKKREMEGFSSFSAGKMIHRTFKHDDFTELIINEVVYILSTYFSLKYGGFKQIRQLALLLADAISDYIDDLEDSIRKAKTITDEDKRSQLILFISIYTFAFLGIHYNKLGIHFKKDEIEELLNTTSKAETDSNVNDTRTAAQAAGGRSSELEIHNEILKLLSKHRTMLFVKFNISVIEQYKRALSRISSDTIEIKSDISSEEIEKLHTDTFYNYLYEVYKLNSIMNNHTIPSITDTKKVANISSESRIKGKSIYDKLEPLNLQFKKETLYTEYLKRSYKYMVDFISNRRFDADFQLIDNNTVDNIEEIISIEKQIIQDNKKPYERITQNFKYKPFNGFYTYPNRGYFYDKSGNKQIYDMVIMKDKSGKIKIFESKNVPLNHNMKVVDFKNSKTGDTLFHPPNVDKSNINKKIEYKDFLDYYLFNCPKGEVHDYKNEKCSKCGFSTDNSFNKETYYKAFIDVFRKINKIKELRLYDPLIIKDKAADKLSCSTVKISNFCKKHKIDYNLVINLGRTEKQEFKNVKSNKLNMENVDENSRTMKLENYINKIIVDYYIIINRKNITDLPKDINKLLENNPKLQLKNIDEQISRYRNNMYMYKNTIGSVHLDINNYIINTIVEIVDNISDKNVVKFMINKIINFDRLYTIAHKLTAKQVQKEMDEWMKDAEEKSDDTLLKKIDEENEDAEITSGEINTSDFSINFDFDISDEEESDMIGDL